MPQLISQELQKGVLNLKILIAPEELKPYLLRAAGDLQKEKPLAGFRPGKAPIENVRQSYGEMKILERALSFAIPAAFANIVKQEKFLTVGAPEIEVTKLTPNQPVEFTAKIATLPSVVLGKYRSIKESKKAIKLTDEEVNEVIENLRTMRAKQKLTDRAATKDDRVIVDLNMTKNGAPIEGGQARGHAIDLFKPYFIEGFADQLIGLKADEQKKFSLPFPKDYYNKNLADSLIDFDVTVRSVYQFVKPNLDDEFAKTLGKFNNVAELRDQIRQNLTEIKEADEDARQEKAIMERLISDSKFGDIPDILIASELEKMLAKQKDVIEHEGGNWNDYLAHLKKTPEELAKGWAPEATKRVKAALVIRAVSEAENIEVTPAEIAAEQSSTLSHYPDNQEAREQIQSEEYAEHLKHILLTRKVMNLLKDIAMQ